MEIDELMAVMARQRADLVALRLLVSGFLVALPPEPRGVVQRQFVEQSEHWLAAALNQAQSDRTVSDVQQAVDRLKNEVQRLMQS